MEEIIFEFIILAICAGPGGFIRWVLFRKKSLKEYIKDDWDVNAFAVGTTVAIVVIIILLLKNI